MERPDSDLPSTPGRPFFEDAVDADDLLTPDLPRLDDLIQAPRGGTVVCQPALSISPVADLFAGADSSSDARQRLLALADRTQGASITHWCVDMGPAYFARNRRLQLEVPRRYLARQPARAELYRDFAPTWAKWLFQTPMPDFDNEGSVRAWSPGGFPRSPVAGGLFFERRGLDTTRLLLRWIYASAFFFDQRPRDRMACGFTSDILRNDLLRSPRHGGYTFVVSQAFWEGGLGPEVVPPTYAGPPIASPRVEKDVVDPKRLLLLERAWRRGQLPNLVRSQSGLAPSADLFGTQSQLFGDRQSLVPAASLGINAMGEAGFQPLFGRRRIGFTAYCDTFQNPNVFFDREIQFPGETCDTYLGRNPSVNQTEVRLSGEHMLHATLVDYYFWLTGGIHHYWRSLPRGSVKNWARIVGMAVFRWGLARLLNQSLMVLHELAHDERVCGGDHCCAGLTGDCFLGEGRFSTGRYRRAIGPHLDCGTDLPSRLWRYCMSATFGLPFVSFNNRTGVTQLPSQAGSLGTGVGGAYGFPVQMEIATQVGACTCTEGDGTWGGELRARGRPMNRGTVVRGVPTNTACTGMQATHRDYWRQRSPSTVSWALNPGCMTDATLAIDSLRYFA